MNGFKLGLSDPVGFGSKLNECSRFSFAGCVEQRSGLLVKFEQLITAVACVAMFFCLGGCSALDSLVPIFIRLVDWKLALASDGVFTYELQSTKRGGFLESRQYFRVMRAQD